MVPPEDDSPQAIDEAMRWLIGQPHGRRVLQWLSQTAGLMAEQFHTNNSQMSFNVGRRSVAVEAHQAARRADEARYLAHISDLL
jgi:hypothetical protein